MAGSFSYSLARLINILFEIYIIIIIIRSVLSWMGNMPHHPLVMILRRLTDPVFRFVHRVFPYTVIGGIDFSPILIVVALMLISNLITNLLLGSPGSQMVPVV